MAARAARRFCRCLVVILSKEKATEGALNSPGCWWATEGALKKSSL